MSEKVMSGNRGKLLFGFVVLHVLCCGLLLLGVGGALGVVGAGLGSPWLALAGGGVVLAAVVLAVRRARTTRHTGCRIPPRAQTTPTPPGYPGSSPGVHDPAWTGRNSDSGGLS